MSKQRSLEELEMDGYDCEGDDFDENGGPRGTKQSGGSDDLNEGDSGDTLGPASSEEADSGTHETEAELEADRGEAANSDGYSPRPGTPIPLKGKGDFSSDVSGQQGRHLNGLGSSMVHSGTGHEQDVAVDAQGQTERPGLVPGVHPLEVCRLQLCSGSQNSCRTPSACP